VGTEQSGAVHRKLYDREPRLEAIGVQESKLNVARIGMSRLNIIGTHVPCDHDGRTSVKLRYEAMVSDAASMYEWNVWVRKEAETGLHVDVLSNLKEPSAKSPIVVHSTLWIFHSVFIDYVQAINERNEHIVHHLDLDPVSEMIRRILSHWCNSFSNII